MKQEGRHTKNKQIKRATLAWPHTAITKNNWVPLREALTTLQRSFWTDRLPPALRYKLNVFEHFWELFGLISTRYTAWYLCHKQKRKD